MTEKGSERVRSDSSFAPGTTELPTGSYGESRRGLVVDEERADASGLLVIMAINRKQERCIHTCLEACRSTCSAMTNGFTSAPAR